MEKLPYEIKLTYIIAIIVMMLFVAFIIAVVFIYNKKQVIQVQEQKLKEAAHNNELLQKELERQKAIHQERERISHDMHDDLGAGISALKLQAEFLKHKVVGNEDLQIDIADMIKTAEEMNLSMREMLWSLNTNNDTLGSFVQYVSLYAENFLRRSKINFFTENNQVSFETNLPSEMRRNLFLCIKESINNVYKHSEAKKLNLLFLQKGNQFIVTIIDDGIGVGTNSGHGNGFQNMNIRMNAINGSFSMQSSEKGTSLQFMIQIEL